MNTFTLKNGIKLKLREGVIGDAGACLAYIEKVSAQSNFLSFGPGEFGLGIKEEEKQIQEKKSRSNELFLLAFIEDTVVSQLTVNASQRKRLRHAVEFGLSVDKQYWGLGIGSAMMTYLLQWAEDNEMIRKVNLQVLPANKNAILLYEKYGFALEGRKLRDNYQNGIFSDILLMGKLID